MEINYSLEVIGKFHARMQKERKSNKISKIFAEMENLKIPPDRKAYSYLLAAYVEEGKLQEATQLKEQIKVITFQTIAGQKYLTLKKKRIKAC